MSVAGWKTAETWKRGHTRVLLQRHVHAATLQQINIESHRRPDIEDGSLEIGSCPVPC